MMINFPKNEEEILTWWEKNSIFAQSIKKSAPAGNFVFFEGPPTANGKPGIHHVLARAFKDVLPRFKTMNGFRVERKAGWDTHGLPVELQVEKKLKISGKPDIEKYGIAKFNQECRQSVWEYQEEWEKLTKRIAFWLDLEHPYVTYENNYIESLWWIFQQIHQQGLVYLGHKVVPHCPRCGTALSSHEVAQGYKLVKENSVYLNFKLLTGNALVKSGDIVLAWTTTPWTLPGNVALAVGEKIEYVKILYQEKNYILAKDRLSIIPGEYQILNSFLGADLVGLTYQPLFNIAAIQQSGQKSYYITDADFVTTADGTGVVHTAVMYGDDDYQLGEKIGLPKVHTVGENGLFTDDLVAYDLAGRFVKDPATEKIIIDYLQNNDLLWRQEEYEHDYPFCWRCDTPLLYYAKDSWFIRMSDPAVKSRLLKNAATINWVPQHIKEGRFGEWLTGV
ncbi:MAG: isoleucine--tRNA ligase, partial [Candidatus Komeilibacteria bacterium CG_4_9_14_3_um_filter_37_5]